MIQNIGRRTFCFEEQPVIIGYAAVAGKKEGEGPLSKFFDRIIYDPYDGMNSFEEAESCMQSEAVSLALEKSGVSADEVDFAFAGDLLNQCTGSGFCLRNFDIPYLGQYGACSTMGQGLMMAAFRRIFVRQSGSTVFRWNTAASERRLPSGRLRVRAAALLRKQEKEHALPMQLSEKSPTSASLTPIIWVPPWHLLRRTP